LAQARLFAYPPFLMSAAKTTTTKTATGSPKSAKAAPPSPVSAKRAASEVTDVKPKKAMCAYMIWLNEVGRKEIIAKQFGGSGKDVKAISKAGGEAWKAMSDADKKKWNDKADDDKIRFQRQMATYVPSETSEPKKKKGKKGKKEKDPNKPKRATTAYFYFLADVRAEIIRVDLKGDGSKVAEVTKIGGAKWKALDAKGKEKYEAMAAKDKERHAKEMEEYNAKNGGDDEDDDEEDEE